ncbi:septin 7a [Planoprotostelium fungivorum]|uniref:Septin 7a n=1 Tax=Planoprotostelium fungivorum TaxID=1890364 RepID=A0A2P6MTG9_9EUKA|nr:septin 7a [Planoprotostelium fungivorum]
MALMEGSHVLNARPLAIDTLAILDENGQGGVRSRSRTSSTMTHPTSPSERQPNEQNGDDVPTNLDSSSSPTTRPRAEPAESHATVTVEPIQDPVMSSHGIQSPAANPPPPTTPLKNHNSTPVTSPAGNPTPVRHERLTLTVAGESGLGKSTFVGSLLVDGQGKISPADGETKGLKRRVFEAKMDSDTGGTWTIETIDTEGYTGDLYRMSTVEHFIVEEYQSVVSRAADVCFYFIAPQRIKDIDFYFIKRLSHLITVVVLVGKSDCMNQKERREFEQLVEQRLDDERIDVFSAESEGGQIKRVFFAIGSETSDDGQPIGRTYDWGTADPELHSDVNLLRTAVLRTHFQWIKDAKAILRDEINRQFFLTRAFQQFHRKHHSTIVKLSWFFLFLFIAGITAFITYNWMTYAWGAHKEAMHMDEMQSIRIESAVMQDDMRRRQAEMEREFDLKKQLLGEKACESARVEITRLEDLLSQEKASRRQVMSDYVKSRDAHDALLEQYESLMTRGFVTVVVGVAATFGMWFLAFFSRKVKTRVGRTIYPNKKFVLVT